MLFHILFHYRRFENKPPSDTRSCQISEASSSYLRKCERLKRKRGTPEPIPQKPADPITATTPQKPVDPKPVHQSPMSHLPKILSQMTHSAYMPTQMPISMACQTLNRITSPQQMKKKLTKVSREVNPCCPPNSIHSEQRT